MATSWKALIGKKIGNVRQDGGIIVLYDEKDQPILMINREQIFDGRGNYIETDDVPSVRGK